MAADNISLRLDGKVAIVTGGGAGIGAATAKLFARQGAHVVIADRKATAGDQTAHEIEASGGVASACATDVSDSAQVQTLMQHAVKTHGGIDVLFNNAGIGLSKPFWEMADEDWNRVLGVNLTGQFLCAKYAVPHMLERGGGAIVNVGSVLGELTMPGQTAYTATKAAIIGMTKAMALDLARRNVRVNCIMPGSIDTPMMWEGIAPEDLPRIAQEAADAIPIGRVASPDEIAAAVLFLVCPAASLITGTTLIADGALSARIVTNY